MSNQADRVIALGFKIIMCSAFVGLCSAIVGFGTLQVVALFCTLVGAGIIVLGMCTL